MNSRVDRMGGAYDRESWSRRANEIRARVFVSSVVGQVVMLKKRGADQFGICPFHNESTPSFTVNDRKQFYHCFGCGEHGDAIGFVMRRQDLEFKAAVELLESENGLQHLKRAPPPPPPKVEQRENLDKAAIIAKIWRDTRPIERGDPIDRYLRGRLLVPPAEYGIGTTSMNAGWPVALRFAPSLWHGLAKCSMPAMVAAFQQPDGRLAAVHRTYLKIANAGVTKAGTDSDKRMFGEPKGAVIRLAEPADKMIGGEGIETSLAAMQLYKRAGLAFGARAGMATYEPPFLCSDFIYAADKNKTHPDPVRSRVGEAAAFTGRRLFSVGRKVQVKIPRLNSPTGDFNDMLRELAEQRSEEAI